MTETFAEIDMLLRKANKIYLSYNAISFSLFSMLFYARGSQKSRMILYSSILTIPTGSILTWAHIFQTFTKPQVTYLLAGLDPTYPSIKESQLKHKDKSKP